MRERKLDAKRGAHVGVTPLTCAAAAWAGWTVCLAIPTISFPTPLRMTYGPVRRSGGKEGAECASEKSCQLFPVSASLRVTRHVSAERECKSTDMPMSLVGNTSTFDNPTDTRTVGHLASGDEPFIRRFRRSTRPSRLRGEKWAFSNDRDSDPC